MTEALKILETPTTVPSMHASDLPRPRTTAGNDMPAAMPGCDSVHLWLFDLDAPAAGPSPADILSDDEQAVAGRFRFARDRRRFETARAHLRRLLGAYLRRQPGEVRFEYGPFGKPALAADLRGVADLRFNVSHSGERCLIAFTRGREIGVDIESTRYPADPIPMAVQFFSPREVARLSAIPASRRRQAFFTVWTQKEAFIKAKGTGLSTALDSFDVSPETSSIGRLATRPDASESARYTLLQIAPADGFAGALAIKGPCAALDFRAPRQIAQVQ